MSYKEINDPLFLEDTLSRKEFYSLRSEETFNFRAKAQDISAPRHLRLQSHQLFVRNFLNPDTPYRSLHLNHSTGSGKTLAALAIAKEFTDLYTKIFNMRINASSNKFNKLDIEKSMPRVFILGFEGTKNAFLRELLAYPEFGFVSIAELDELNRRRVIAQSGLAVDKDSMREYRTMLRKRIHDAKKGGFFRFYGYDEFVNRLFTPSEGIKLTDIEAETEARIKQGENVTLESVIEEYIQQNKIKLTYSLLARFENSLLICDEIHNTYNTHIKNNRGVAVQYLLDNVKTLRFLSLSATPINNSPTEVVELINYHVTRYEKVSKRDLFINNRTPQKNALDRIGHLMNGKVSFIQDSNPKYYPRTIWYGEYLKIPAGYYDFDTIPYLRFIACPMSEYHEKTWLNYKQNYVKGREDIDEETGHTPIPQEGSTIFDMVFPNPNSEFGLFRTQESNNAISSASDSWREIHGIHKVRGAQFFSGDFLVRENIQKYSTKIVKMLDIIDAHIIEGKLMVYHNRVRMSGVLIIAECLRMNGYIDEFSEPLDSTKCKVCNTRMDQHSIKTHDFIPARFVTVHSDIDKSIMGEIIARFNAPENANGDNIAILVGGKIIKESYSFSDVRHLICMSLPLNIPTLIQVLGRCIRKRSHFNLPSEKRTAGIHLLLSTINAPGEISPEMQKYIEKILDYKTIQLVERELNRNAIDAPIHRSINMSPSMHAEYFPNGAQQPISKLGNMYFDPVYELPLLREINDTTHRILHSDEEVVMLTHYIKRLFVQQTMWTYDDLWRTMLDPPFATEVNPSLFNEDNFIIALDNMVRAPNTGISLKVNADLLFDSTSKVIIVNGKINKIHHIGPYYILFPLIAQNPNAINSQITQRIKVKYQVEEQMINMLVDVETYNRHYKQDNAISIPINDFLVIIKRTQDNNIILNRFLKSNKETHIFNYSIEEQLFIVESAIRAYNLPNFNSRYKKLLDYMTKFGAIIYFDEVKRYREIAKMFVGGIPTLPASTPIGYVTPDSIKIFNVNIGDFFSTTKTSMNRQRKYEERSPVIGYIESVNGVTKFKIRKSVTEIKNLINKNKKKDNRLILRGIVCNTVVKEKLIENMRALKIPIGKQARVKNACEAIKQEIILQEIKERAEDSRYKCFYGWWDDLVDLMTS